MALPAIAMAIGGAVMGAISNQEKQKARDEQQKYEAMKTRGAPFTGQWGQHLQSPSLSADILKGALGGASMYSQNAGMFGQTSQTSDPSGNSSYTGTYDQAGKNYSLGLPEQKSIFNNNEYEGILNGEYSDQPSYSASKINPDQYYLMDSTKEAMPNKYGLAEESLSDRIARMRGI
jgi:hypothetical protein